MKHPRCAFGASPSRGRSQRPGKAGSAAATLFPLLLGTLLLAGCAMVGPNYERPAHDLPLDYPPLTSSPEATIPTNWWTLYGDATLNDLIASSLTQSADIRQAAALVEEAQGALREVDASFYPQVDGSFSGSRSRASSEQAIGQPSPLVRDDRRLAASTSFELDFWGRLRRGAEAARAQVLSTRYGRDVVALTLAATTAQTYFLLRAADAQLGVARESLAARDDALKLVRDRVAGGVASNLDLYQAEGARADAAVQVKDLERQRQLYEHQLGQLAGKPGLRLVPGDLATLPNPPVPPAGLPSALLERRPDVRVAEQNLVAANARIGVARAAMYPTITLTGLFGGQSAAMSDLLDGGARIWSLGFGLTLPIFDAGRVAARTEQAEARERQAVALYQKSVQAAFREVADAISNLQQTTAVEGDLQQRVASAREALRLSRVRYEAGYSAFLEVLDAQRNANDAELALVRNRQARLAYSVDLMKALGGGWVAPDVSSPSAISRP